MRFFTASGALAALACGSPDAQQSPAEFAPPDAPEPDAPPSEPDPPDTPVLPSDTLSLTAADLTVTGVSPEGMLEARGWAGDVDGDGGEDLLLADSADAGRLWLLSGGLTGSVAVDALGTVLFEGAPGDEAGAAVARLDFTGDGVEELVIGAPGGSRAYVVAAPPTASDPSTAIATLIGLPGGGVGMSLASAGDVDQDGRQDLFVGSTHAGIFLVAGGPGARDLSSDHLAVMTHTEGLHGHVIATADFDGDGVLDLLAGAPTDTWAGEPWGSGAVYMYGAPSGVLAAADAEAVLVGDAEAAQMGWAVQGADLDGDGYAEAVIGAPMPSGVGEVRVHAGPFSGLLRSGDAVARIQGEPGEGFGWTLQLADVDGDGEVDLVVGAPLADDDSGRVLVFSGPLAGTLSSDDATLVVEAAAGSGGHAGSSLLAGADADGDGVPDLVVGALDAAGLLGEVYLLSSPL